MLAFPRQQNRQHQREIQRAMRMTIVMEVTQPDPFQCFLLALLALLAVQPKLLICLQLPTFVTQPMLIYFL